ncbi:MAG: hypothetical protein K0R77_2885 [Chryseobacterium sp.]|jgi:hypothetical protein|uniref:hypothetical protein n=1 Tax=Chryseobacterium sp. TaxID=1871047 RepID=UPI002636A1A5|nr:hypothetical protein [Chryseobacterium sp.]MDF2553610.1 hypothetical protein [Chryseobacterium sp.]
MDTGKIKIEELKDIISEKLNYNIISKLSVDEYRKFIYDFFNILSLYKQQGVKREDIEGFINKLYTNQSSHFSGDIIKEDMFSFITEEILNFCPSPFFWNISLEEYMQKWEKIYFSSLN